LFENIRRYGGRCKTFYLTPLPTIPLSTSFDFAQDGSGEGDSGGEVNIIFSPMNRCADGTTINFDNTNAEDRIGKKF